MTAVWDDANFGAAAEFSGYAESPRLNVLFSPAQIGQGKRRRQYSGTNLRDITFTKTWHNATYRLFLAWFQNETAEGTIDFTMSDTTSGDTGTFLFDPVNPYSAVNVGPGTVRVTLNVQRIS